MIRAAQRQEGGAAAVELAASIPIVVFFLLLLVQYGVVMFDQLAVAQAAREGARAAAVDPDTTAAVTAASQATRLDVHNLSVSVGSRPAVGQLLSVRVTYRARITVPFTGQVLVSPTVSSTAAMAVEGPGS